MNFAGERFLIEEMNKILEDAREGKNKHLREQKMSRTSREKRRTGGTNKPTSPVMVPDAANEHAAVDSQEVALRNDKDITTVLNNTISPAHNVAEESSFQKVVCVGLCTTSKCSIVLPGTKFVVEEMNSCNQTKSTDNCLYHATGNLL